MVRYVFTQGKWKHMSAQTLTQTVHSGFILNSPRVERTQMP